MTNSVTVWLFPVAEICAPLRTNNLFFADDGNFHANDLQVVQKGLDLTYKLESEFGMKFSPSKCFVLSKQENVVLHIGGLIFSQVEEAVYLGILSAKGLNSESFVKNCARKMVESFKNTFTTSLELFNSSHETSFLHGIKAMPSKRS